VKKTKLLEGKSDFLIELCFLPFYFYLCNIIHELGHLLICFLFNVKVLTITVTIPIRFNIFPDIEYSATSLFFGLAISGCALTFIVGNILILKNGKGKVMGFAFIFRDMVWYQLSNRLGFTGDWKYIYDLFPTAGIISNILLIGYILFLLSYYIVKAHWPEEKGLERISNRNCRHRSLLTNATDLSVTLRNFQ